MKIYKFVILILWSTLVMAESNFVTGYTPDEGFIKTNVFDNDDRELVGYTSMPYNWIVKVGHGCTGALVGKNLVLTAAHCIAGYLKQRKNGVYYFAKKLPIYVHYSKGRYTAKALVISAIFGKVNLDKNSNSSSAKEDWAILTLNSNLGQEYGFFGHILSLNYSETYHEDISLGGFSGDLGRGEVLSVHNNCSVRVLSIFSFSHDCDMTKGASGAPIWIKSGSDYFIIGINFAERRDNRKESYISIPFYKGKKNMAILPEV